MGITPLEKAIQTESIDDDLRNDLWSALETTLWVGYEPHNYHRLEFNKSIDTLIQVIWTRLFKLAIDTAPPFKGTRGCAHIQLRALIMEGPWYKVYDLIEFILQNAFPKVRDYVRKALNEALARENSGYRFVDLQLVQITATDEIKAIEEALTKGNAESKAHFSRALELLSDRKAPDYRNSIKESISAVESVCKAIAESPSATINDALKIIKKTKEIHPAFEQALIKLFAYTSDSGGIRHGLSEGAAPPTYADAKFMLVSCSAFCSYLWTQAA